jgi:hypothetical protein
VSFFLRIEYLIVILFRSKDFLKSVPDWSFREHFSRALPNEKIFNLLLSIRSKFAELMPDKLEIIMKWLQSKVSVIECNRKSLRLKI